MDDNGRPFNTSKAYESASVALRELRRAKLELDDYRCQLQFMGCTRTATTVHVSTEFDVDHASVTLPDLTSCCHHCYEIVETQPAAVPTSSDSPSQRSELPSEEKLGEKLEEKLGEKLKEKLDDELEEKLDEVASPSGVPERGGAQPTPYPRANHAWNHAERNRAAWDRWAADYARRGREGWEGSQPRWGIWGLPESEIGLLEGLEPGLDAVELGCGAASVSSWLARAGMIPVGIDISNAQLETARQLQEEFGVEFPLVCANAEEVPFQYESFDLAVSDYGASVWCDPERWVPEAARLLRPNGLLVFFVNSALLMACTPPDGSAAGERLERDYFGMFRIEFPDEDAVEFHLSHGEWVRVLRASGFVVDGLIEVQAPASGPVRSHFAPREWAMRWPSEDIWIARKAPSNQAARSP